MGLNPLSQDMITFSKLKAGLMKTNHGSNAVVAEDRSSHNHNRVKAAVADNVRVVVAAQDAIETIAIALKKHNLKLQLV